MTLIVCNQFAKTKDFSVVINERIIVLVNICSLIFFDNCSCKEFLILASANLTALCFSLSARFKRFCNSSSN